MFMRKIVAILCLLLFVSTTTLFADELDLLINTNTSSEMQGKLYLNLCKKDFSEIAPKLAKLITTHPVITGIGPKTDKPWNEKQLSKGDRIGCTLSQLWHQGIQQKSYTERIELMMKILDNPEGGRERQIALSEISSSLHFGGPKYIHGGTLSSAEVNKTINHLNRFAFDESESIELRKAVLPILFEHGDPNKYLDLAIKITDIETNPLVKVQLFRHTAPTYNNDKYTPENRNKYLKYAFDLLKQVNDGKTGKGYFLARHLGRFVGIKNEFTPNENPSECKAFFQTTVDNALKWWEENQQTKQVINEKK